MPRPIVERLSSNGQSDDDATSTDMFRLPLNLLDLVVSEVSGHVKKGPLHHDISAELKRFASTLVSFTSDHCPTNLSTISQEVTDNIESDPITVVQSDNVTQAPLCFGSTDGAVSPISNSATYNIQELPQAPALLNVVEQQVAPTSKVLGQNNLASGASQNILDANSQEILLNVFYELDTSGSGTLSTAELRPALEAVGVPAARAQKIINASDIDGSGEIDVSEWKKTVAKEGDEEVQQLAQRIIKYEISHSGKGAFSHSRTDTPSTSFMIPPDSVVRLLWDANLALLCVYVAVVLPFTNGFSSWISDETSRTFLRIEFAIDMIFLLDVCLNFRTGVMEKDGTIILNWRTVGRRYLFSWFILDLASSIPLSEISQGRVASVRPLKILKIPKLLRASRLVCQSEAWLYLDDSVGSPLLRSMLRRSNIIMLTCLICHWLACLMAFCSTEWLTDYILDSNLKVSLWRVYLVALYAAMTTLTTVGYGDITPRSDVERIFSLFSMIIGGAFYGFAVGNICSMVSNRDLNASAYYDRMDSVYAWLDHHQFSSKMRRRIIRYFKEYLTDHAAVEDVDIVDDLSPALQKEVGESVIHADVRNNPLFDNLPVNAVIRVQKVMHKVIVEEASAVVIAGEAGTAMFIVHTGTVKLDHCDADGNKMPTRILSRGDSFGEEILTGLKERYGYTVTCSSGPKRTILHMLEEAAYQNLFQHMPDIKKQVEKNAASIYASSILKQSS